MVNNKLQIGCNLHTKNAVCCWSDDCSSCHSFGSAHCCKEPFQVCWFGHKCQVLPKHSRNKSSMEKETLFQPRGWRIRSCRERLVHGDRADVIGLLPDVPSCWNDQLKNGHRVLASYLNIVHLLFSVWKTLQTLSICFFPTKKRKKNCINSILRMLSITESKFTFIKGVVW